jgi:hypothetical protein
MSDKVILGNRKLYGEQHYNELVNIIDILKDGLECIASDNIGESEQTIAIETLQSMEDTCKQSNLVDILLLPKRLNT